MGNTLHNDPRQASQDECKMSCAGNPAEICGDGNHVQVYQDSAWVDPTKDDLIKALNQYNDSLTQAANAITKYRNDIQALKDTLTKEGRGPKAKRQEQAETIELQEIRRDAQILPQVQQILGLFITHFFSAILPGC